MNSVRYRHLEITLMEFKLNALGKKWETPPPIWKFENLSVPLPNIDDIVELIILGSPLWKALREHRDDVTREFLILVLLGISGTYIFATTNGIVGLATAPARKGDILAIIHQYPAYVILRETKHNQGSASQGTQKHQKVARAAITGTLEKMKARIDEGPQESALPDHLNTHVHKF